MIMRQSYSETVDSWTAGVLAYEFLVGRPPFMAPTQQEAYSKILEADYTCPPHVSIGPRHFLSCALRVNPIKRYSAGELFLHGWIQEQDEASMSIVEWESHEQAKEGMTTARSARLSFDSMVKGTDHQITGTDQKENSEPKQDVSKEI
jgi:serine/threonine protein kinase